MSQARGTAIFQWNSEYPEMLRRSCQLVLGIVFIVLAICIANKIWIFATFLTIFRTIFYSTFSAFNALVMNGCVKVREKENKRHAFDQTSDTQLTTCTSLTCQRKARVRIVFQSACVPVLCYKHHCHTISMKLDLTYLSDVSTDILNQTIFI